jgi:hypothetical protein
MFNACHNKILIQILDYNYVNTYPILDYIVHTDIQIYMKEPEVLAATTTAATRISTAILRI